ncbi:MAG: hypothetical protein R3F43_19645 [bacterium]
MGAVSIVVEGDGLDADVIEVHFAGAAQGHPWLRMVVNGFLVRDSAVPGDEPLTVFGPRASIVILNLDARPSVLAATWTISVRCRPAVDDERLSDDARARYTSPEIPDWVGEHRPAQILGIGYKSASRHLATGGGNCWSNPTLVSVLLSPEVAGLSNGTVLVTPIDLPVGATVTYTEDHGNYRHPCSDSAHNPLI